MKKKFLLLTLSTMLLLSACGNTPVEEVDGTPDIQTTAETTNESLSPSAETTMDNSTDSVNTTAPSNRTELSGEALLDLFLDGGIKASYPNDEQDPFYITDLSIDEEDAFSYSIGDRVDLDNDNELELILDGAYGGKYIDARDGEVFVLDEGWGTAGTLSYTSFDDQTWIVHNDTTHSGRYVYDFTLYDGAGNVTDTFQLTQEFWDTPEKPDGPDTVYTYRGESITRTEYMTLREKMLHIPAPEEEPYHYVAPTAVSESLYEFDVQFEGAFYSLPCPVTELQANGFIMEGAPAAIGAINSGNNGSYVKFVSGNKSFTALVLNYSTEDASPENCFVSELTTISDDGSTFDLQIPCDIKIGDSEEVLKEKIGEYYYDYDENGEWLFVNQNFMVYSYGILVKDGAVTAIKVSNPVHELK